MGPRPPPWPADPRLDPELLAHGDRRNVIDRYRYWHLDAIVADLDERRHPFHVATLLPRRCVLLFGQEGPGLSTTAHAACATVCSIAQLGSTRSINAGVASGIAMHTWLRQHALEP